MPTYEYLCKMCSHRFEQWQKMTDEPLTICPECGGSIRRVFYPAGIVFKGSGFYKTDHNAPAPVAENGHAKKGESGTAAASSDTNAASESKPGTAEAASGSGAKSGSSTTSESKVATPAK